MVQKKYKKLEKRRKYLYDCIELNIAPEWDGHCGNDVERLLSLI